MLTALGLVAATAGVGHAAPVSGTTPKTDGPLMTYNTIGSTIGTSGITGNPVIKFIPVTGGSFLAPSNLSFGKFQIDALPTGQRTVYNNTPVAIKFQADALNGQSIAPNETPIEVSGVLNGEAIGDNQSTVVATFNPLAKAEFQTGLYKNTLGLPDTPLRINPSTSNGGVTTAQAFLSNSSLDPNPIPEPSTLALFAVTLFGFAARRRLLVHRAA
jgi:hypothetical protein